MRPRKTFLPHGCAALAIAAAFGVNIVHTNHTGTVDCQNFCTILMTLLA